MSDRDHTRAAIERLANALYELSTRGVIHAEPAIRMLLCPSEAIPEDVKHLHAFGISPEAANALAEAVEQLLITIDTASEPVDPTAAQDFARSNPELAKDVASAFTGIDLTELAGSVLDASDPTNRMSVNRALDAMFGHITQEAEDDE